MQHVQETEVLVIGGGPAGLFCAIKCALAKRKVLLLEKMPSCGRKLLITGSGQCNLTHEGDIDGFFSRYGDHGAFLRPALKNLTNRDLVDFFESRGLPMTALPGGKIFPSTMNASDVLGILLGECRRSGVVLHCGEPVREVSCTRGKFVVTTQPRGGEGQEGRACFDDMHGSRGEDQPLGRVQGKKPFKGAPFKKPEGPGSVPILEEEISPRYPGSAPVPDDDTALRHPPSSSPVSKEGGSLRSQGSAPDPEEAGSRGQPVPAPAPKETGFSRYLADLLVIATGGASYPATGSSGDGFGMMRGLGHPVTEIGPALVPVLVEQYPFADMAGISFEGVEISVFRSGRKVRKGTGDLLFTHEGLSGPGILDLSRYIQPGDSVQVSFIAGRNREKVAELLLDALAKDGSRQVKSILRDLPLPDRLARRLPELGGIPAERTSAQLTKKERGTLVSLVSEFRYEVRSLAGFDQAMVTRGGAALEAIDPKSMGSRSVPGLYIIGEALDIDGDTGGYNLQAAFSTAALAATDITKRKG
jgi:predicted flavoprotein YhiN